MFYAIGLALIAFIVGLMIGIVYTSHYYQKYLDRVEKKLAEQEFAKNCSDLNDWFDTVPKD